MTSTKPTGKHSTDYHDYVFRDGEPVGDFEGMCRHSTEIPWLQDTQENRIDVRLTLEMLKDFGSFEEIHALDSRLEVGGSVIASR